MNDPAQHTEDPLANASREEIMSALFANMVIQQTNMAMMMLGKVAHPETGQFMQDIDTAKMFIDQLEMLEAKTKGNLTKQEEGLMKQALGALHMAFVESVEAPAGGPPPELHEEEAEAPAADTGAAPEVQRPAAAPGITSAEPTTPPHDESRKKFSKKY
jgi:hypothetical protein